MEYKWTVSAMSCAPELDGLTDVVKVVHWRRSLTDGEYTVETYGACPVGSPAPEQFVSYQDLTEEEVVSWLEATLNVPEISEQLIKALNNVKSPSVVTLPPPFQNTVEQEPEIPTEQGIVE